MGFFSDIEIDDDFEISKAPSLKADCSVEVLTKDNLLEKLSVPEEQLGNEEKYEKRFEYIKEKIKENCLFTEYFKQDSSDFVIVKYDDSVVIKKHYGKNKLFYCEEIVNLLIEYEISKMSKENVFSFIDKELLLDVQSIVNFYNEDLVVFINTITEFKNKELTICFPNSNMRVVFLFNAIVENSYNIYKTDIVLKLESCTIFDNDVKIVEYRIGYNNKWNFIFEEEKPLFEEKYLSKELHLKMESGLNPSHFKKVKCKCGKSFVYYNLNKETYLIKTILNCDCMKNLSLHKGKKGVFFAEEKYNKEPIPFSCKDKYWCGNNVSLEDKIFYKFNDSNCWLYDKKIDLVPGKKFLFHKYPTLVVKTKKMKERNIFVEYMSIDEMKIAIQDIEKNHAGSRLETNEGIKAWNLFDYELEKGEHRQCTKLKKALINAIEITKNGEYEFGSYEERKIFYEKLWNDYQIYVEDFIKDQENHRYYVELIEK